MYNINGTKQFKAYEQFYAQKIKNGGDSWTNIFWQI